MAGKLWTGRLLPPAQITPQHRLDRFDSGIETINGFLKNNALSNHRERYSLVLVLADEDQQVLGYYALTIGQVARKTGLKGKTRRGAPANIPAIILGRLGVDQRLQGRGIGRDLLTHAIGVTLMLSQEKHQGFALPISVMAIKALNEGVASFYGKVGFKSFDPENPPDLVRSIRDLRADYEAAAGRST